MPFTLSHAIVALPFARGRVPAAAVAIGAMAPDAPLFFRVGVDYYATHTFPGMFLVGLPVAVLLLLVWRMLLRPAAAELAPAWLRTRLPSGWRSSAMDGWCSTWGGRVASGRQRAAAIALVTAGLGIGIVSHVVWDSFTHSGRQGSAIFPGIAEEWGPLPGYEWLQHGSTVLGLAVLAIWAVLRVRQTPAVPFQPASPGWLRVLLAASVPGCLAVGAAFVATVTGPPSLGTLRDFAFLSGTAGAAGILIVTAVCALLAQTFAHRAVLATRRAP